MTVEEWLACVKAGGFIDYDGMGSWATATHIEAGYKHVYPSDTVKPGFTPPVWATHVMWYNR